MYPAFTIFKVLLSIKTNIGAPQCNYFKRMYIKAYQIWIFMCYLFKFLFFW